MSAENGNRYAEKWTYEATMKALEKINTFAMMDDTLYLGMALARAGYYDDIWRYWRKKWARNYEIIHEMKMLMQHFEAQIYTNTAHGKIPLRLGIFTLQHHYGWGREPQQEDVSCLAEADKTPLPTLSEGEGLMQTAGLSQPSPKERALMQTAHLSQTLSKGEGLTAADSQRLFKEEDSNVEAVSVDEVTTEAQNEVVAPAASAKRTKRYPMELTPEELQREVGISDIREIERRLREEDPELAEFDDMDEDMEWEVETPETFKR
ncbi:MAG: hypothetical protein JST76_07480 [Bacteroidetes bacterium]|nr:hypothetical protein [Bacteroidota bacterium]